jgi:hypothetical protein
MKDLYDTVRDPDGLVSVITRIAGPGRRYRLLMVKRNVLAHVVAYGSVAAFLYGMPISEHKTVGDAVRACPEGRRVYRVKLQMVEKIDDVWEVNRGDY